MTPTSRILSNLPPLSWGMKDITFAGALESASAVTTNPWNYQDILGITGLAFRTRWYLTGDERGWDGAAPIAEEREEIALFAGSGWRLYPAVVGIRHPTLVELGLNFAEIALPPMPTPQPNREALQFREQIVESIDAGIPVLCKDRKSLDMSLIYGYEEHGETMVISDYWGADTRVPLAEMWPFFLFLTPSEPVEPLNAARQGIEQAIHNWQRATVAANSICLWNNHPSSATYLYGEEAYTRWIADLGRVGELDAQKQGQLFHATWWNIDCWHSARSNAQSYLKELAAQLDGESANALLRAAGCYDEQCRRFHATMAPHGDSMAFLGPWTGKGIAQWSDEVRANERELLASFRELDALAIAELQASLATWPDL